MTHAKLFARGFVIVALTAANVRAISALHYPWAFAGGFGISFIWFGNSKTAAHVNTPYAREVYALGAALGTVFGMWLGR